MRFLKQNPKTIEIMISPIKVNFILVILLSATSFKVIATQLQFTDLFLPSAQSGDKFGWSVSVSNTLAVVGSQTATRNSFSNCGSASIWQYDPKLSIWNSLIIIEAYDRSSGDNFGNSVSIASSSPSSPARVLIGSPFHSILPHSGVAYLYEQQPSNTSYWSNKTQLIPPNPQSGASFGYFLTLSPSGSSSSFTYAVISAPSYSGSFSNDGTVYIFNKDQGGIDNWGFVKQLSASDPHQNDDFGTSVAINEDLVLVGAILGDSSSINVDTGTAYLFSKDVGGQDNWGMIKRFTSPNLMLNDYFGGSVSISGDFIIIGAYGVQNRIGMAHLYYRNNGGIDQWGLSSNISRINGQIGDNFGFPVVLQESTSTIIIGADGVNSSTGIASVVKFNLDGTIITTSLFVINDPVPAVPNDVFGYSISADNNLVIFGSPFRNGSGKAYSIELPFTLNSPLCSTLCKILIIIGIIIVISGLVVGVIIIKNKKHKLTITSNNPDMSTISIINERRNEADMRSNSTVNSVASGTSQVRQIELSENMSIRSKDLDLRNPKVIKRI